MFSRPVFKDKFNDVMSCASNGGKELSITVTFRGLEGRHLVIYGDAKVPGRFVTVSMQADTASRSVQEAEMAISDS